MSASYALGYISSEGNGKVMGVRRSLRAGRQPSVHSANLRSQTRKQHPLSVKLYGLLWVVAVLILVWMLVDTVSASASQTSEGGHGSTLPMQDEPPVSIEHQTAVERTIIVQAGDTLWTIARDHKPEQMKIRVYLEQLKSVNGLEGSIIHEGMQLTLPE